MIELDWKTINKYRWVAGHRWFWASIDYDDGAFYQWLVLGGSQHRVMGAGVTDTLEEAKREATSLIRALMKKLPYGREEGYIDNFLESELGRKILLGEDW